MVLATKKTRQNIYFAIVSLVLAGCASGAGLLEPKSNSGLLTNNQLAMPPEDALAVTAPGPSQDDDMPVSDGVPTVTALNSFVQPGIDPAKEAKELENGIQTAAVDPSIKWRGKISDDGIDLANVNGVLCSSPMHLTSKSQSLQLACSDGRMAHFKFNAELNSAAISFGATFEKVMLELN